MKKFYLTKVHRLNAPFIKFFKERIVYFQNELMGSIELPENAKQVDDENNIDLWIQSLEDAFFMAKDYYSKPFPLPEREKLKKLNLYRSYVEFEAKVLEDNLSFLDVIAPEKKEGDHVSSHFLIHPLLKKRYQWDFLTFIDCLKHWKETQVSLLSHIAVVFLYFFSQLKLDKKYQGSIRGLTPSEIPSSDISLNCFWFTSDKILEPKDSYCGNYFYFVDRLFKKKAQDVKAPFDMLTHFDMLKTLELSQKMTIFASLIRLFVKNFFSFNLVSYFLAKSVYKSLLWKYFAHNNGMKWSMTSISENCPAPFELEVLNHMNVKTIIWSYSYYGFRPSSKKPFQNFSLLMSLSHHRYILMWDEAVNAFLKDCELNVFDDHLPKKYFATGPILNGRIHHLEISQEEALKKLGLPNGPDKFYVSIFDLVAWKKHYRIAHAINPFMTEAAQDRFYNEIMRLLNDFPNLVILFKPKRGISEILHLPKMRDQIIKGNLDQNLAQKIILLEENIDPLLVVKASNFVITSFFTSPSAIAMDVGIPSVYFEPEKHYNFITPKKIQAMYINEYDVLKEKVAEAQRNSRAAIEKDHASHVREIFKTILSDRA